MICKFRIFKTSYQSSVTSKILGCISTDSLRQSVQIPNMLVLHPANNTQDLLTLKNHDIGPFLGQSRHT